MLLLIEATATGIVPRPPRSPGWLRRLYDGRRSPLPIRGWGGVAPHRVIHGDTLPVLRTLPDALANLIYIDPPFSTGRDRSRTVTRATPDPTAVRAGFRGTRDRSAILSRSSSADQCDDFLAFLEPRLDEAYRVMAPDGTLYVHLDDREVHSCRLLDALFGDACFLDEIIWAYDYGGRTKRRWPPKHDNILVYV